MHNIKPSSGAGAPTAVGFLHFRIAGQINKGTKSGAKIIQPVDLEQVKEFYLILRMLRILESLLWEFLL